MSALLAILLLGLILASLSRDLGFGGRLVAAVVFVALLARMCQGWVPPVVLATLPLAMMAAAIWIILFGVVRHGVR